MRAKENLPRKRRFLQISAQSRFAVRFPRESRYGPVMVTVAQCNSIDEALLLRSLLEGNGIKAFVPDEMTAQTAPPYLFAGMGVRVQVDAKDAEIARLLIAHPEAPAEPTD